MASRSLLRRLAGSTPVRNLSLAPANVNVDNTIKICVVGAGAAGFYTTQHLLKNSNVHVDIYETLPVPFGLVRYGVAPDHPEVKNCIKTFSSIAKNPRCRYYGNVTFGSDVKLKQLRDAYHAVVLAYGADREKQLNVPGENLKYVLSARQFVNWYNGHPTRITTQEINFDAEECSIIGHGNVALDIARILLTAPHKLKKTDITDEAIEHLSCSRIKRVHLIGRRGPLQVAFTIKELRELMNLEDTIPILHAENFAGIDTSTMQRPRKRLMELMLRALGMRTVAERSNKMREWELKFLRSPIEFKENANNLGTVGSLILAVNELEDDGKRAVATVQTECLPTSFAIKSVGYSSSCPDEEIPFDSNKGTISNESGRVRGMPGVYCSGWVRTGPVGVIVSTMNSSFETGANLLNDLSKGILDRNELKMGSLMIVDDVLKSKGIQHLSFNQWEKIAAHEASMGSRKGKVAEKILSKEEMLQIALS